jgi:hypothetical protein
MSKRFEFERFDLRGCACDECDTGVTAQSEFDGEWVKAQDALDREAVLQAQIRTIETQLKDARDIVARFRWLEARFIGADFEWGSDAEGKPLQALVFRMEPGMRVCVDLAITIDAARGKV